MKWNSEKTERILWILAVSLALALRLIRLGAAPLTDWEAGNALPIFDWLRSGVLPSGSQAGYTLFSGLMAYLFGVSNFAARFIPALVGSLLVLSPLLFRRQLGRWPALIAAFGLAIDPALVAISRQADGGIWAIAFTLFGLGFLLHRRPVWAGVALGLALLGGPALWIGWLSLGAALLINFRRLASDSRVETSGASAWQTQRNTVLLSAGITLAAAGTLFFFAPFGLSMALQSIPDFLHQWTQTGMLDLRSAAMALICYATFPLVLGIIQAVQGWTRKNAVDQFLSVWLILALMLWFACPGRQISFAGWIMLPLWALAARQAAGWLRKPIFDIRFTAATALVVFVLLFFIILNAVAILHPAGWSAQTEIQIIKIVVAVVLLGLSILLVGWGWNWDAAGEGVQWGFGAALLIILLSMSIHASGLSKRPEAELLRSGAYNADADLVQSTLRDLSTHKTGQFHQLQIAVVGIDSPALKWLLRDDANVQYSDSISSMESPDVIITNDQIQPGQVSTYRGQDFVWTRRPAWGQMDGVNWMQWLVFRETPDTNSKIILWARTDLFPGESAAETTP
ncbi:hypothetical protein LARV_02189 [Longilinea arvoryzae]|uniref:4-amino-4-deoxy-L-arabinose transferase n=1 Tax=Longilinea arvoryzae TaxID=360412 RepID=A0A0S7BH65_9CHLR|nr:hypothetical protein [Longilinea arvoryzae]GAP14420.1 hypothetical protein LARV_02189 [Longilinea arvoryzae]